MRCSRLEQEVAVMRSTRLVVFVCRLLALLATPTVGLAQTPADPSTSTMPAPGTSGAQAGVAAVVVLMAMLVIIVIPVKLYDLRRKREEEALSLEARISSALLADPCLMGFPVIASVHMPLGRRSTPVVKITGTVPTPELREAAIQLVKRELSGPGSSARTEDRIVVEPLMVKRVA